MSVTPHRRQLLRPRASQTKLSGSINTVSTPDLAGSCSNAAPQRSGSTRPGLTSAGQLPRTSSLSALTQGSLASIPDASGTYGLSAVLDEDEDEDEDDGKMSYSPSRNGGEVEVGDLVDVPGNMYGSVKFLGGIHGKDGVFAGVELSREFAGRGKNNGDVEGVSYFRTSIPGAGIFLPIARAIPRGSNPSGSHTPRTPSALGLRPGYSFTPPTPAIPANFSQSIGPGSRAQSPFGKKSRPSLPRPESPIRRTATLTPGPGRNQYGGVTPQPQRFASPAPSKFGQSVRGTRDTSGDPPKKLAFTPKSNFKASVGPSRGQSRSNSSLGRPMSFGSDDEENTPTMGRGSKHEDSLGSTASFNAKMRPLEHKTKEQEEELQRLRTQLDERDKQLREQASSLAEMENSLNEVQSLMGAGSDNGRRSTDDRDTAQLRAILREKNEKIASLTAEFDAHRADFRSTIDTLEMAASETERVYEQKVEDLLQQLHEHQERSEDVHSVAAQLKQLEELVQELEEGLEDARRGESEARGEVEFLRGEVERGRAELRREREKIAELQEKVQEKGQGVAKEVAQRDDEIRGLKAIIHSLSKDQQQQQQQQHVQPQRRSSGGSQRRPSGSMEARTATEALESEIQELKRILEAKINKEEVLERELQQLRRTSNSGPTLNSQRASNMTLRSVQSNGTIKDDKPLPERPIHASGSYSRRSSMSPDLQRKGPLAGVPESDTYSATTDESTLWCEICETGGHDILTCTNMFGAAANETPKHGHPSRSGSRMADKAMPPPPPPQRTGKDLVRETLGANDEFRPAPLTPLKKPSIAAMQLQEVREAEKPVPPPRNQSPEESRNPAAPAPNQSFSMEEAVAGKESGVIDTNKWCALCERDGHESVDCPFEDVY